jgi:hypothetical protein
MVPAMADDSEIRELRERVEALEARVAALESGTGSADRLFTDVGRATAEGARKGAKAAEELLAKGLDALRRSKGDD